MLGHLLKLHCMCVLCHWSNGLESNLEQSVGVSRLSHAHIMSCGFVV